MSEKIPTIRQLTSLCREWQKTLRLQDWRVRIVAAQQYEIPDKQADIYVVHAVKQAKIRINFYCQWQEFADPWELALIHELLHLHIEPLLEKEPPDWKFKISEQAIDCIAWGLYRTKYGNRLRDKFVDP